jgi:hypothetical protein
MIKATDLDFERNLREKDAQANKELLENRLARNNYFAEIELLKTMPEAQSLLHKQPISALTRACVLASLLRFNVSKEQGELIINEILSGTLTTLEIKE